MRYPNPAASISISPTAWQTDFEGISLRKVERSVSFYWDYLEKCGEIDTAHLSALLSMPGV